MTKLVHFVGVAKDQFWHAVAVWGFPHYEHPRATWSCMGEISGDDIVILGRGAFSHTRRHPKGAHTLTEQEMENG